MGEAAIEALAASIQHKGLIQNLVIEPEAKEDGTPTGYYFVTAGWRCCCAPITEYSASEYVDASTKLCHALSTHTPLEIANEVNRWVAEGPAFKDCLVLHDVGKADALNLPIQVIFGQFASFARDKANYPHIFCWPGAHMAGRKASEESIGLFSRQSHIRLHEEQMLSGLDAADRRHLLALLAKIEAKDG